MTASPTPFFAESAVVSHETAAHETQPVLRSTDETQAPAAMPSEEEIEAEIRPMSYEGADLTECVARILALFAPILAEKEREYELASEGRAAFAARALEAERPSLCGGGTVMKKPASLLRRAKQYDQRAARSDALAAATADAEERKLYREDGASHRRMAAALRSEAERGDAHDR